MCYQVSAAYGRPFELPRYMITAMNYVQNGIYTALAAAECHVPQGLYCKLWKYDKNSVRQIVLSAYIPQMEVSEATKDYWVVIKEGEKAVNFADEKSIWTYVQSGFIATLTTLIGLSTQRLTLALLDDYAASKSMSAIDLIIASQWRVQTVAAALTLYSAYRSAGVNPWPKDKSRKQE